MMIEQVVDLCKLHGKQAALYGKDTEEISRYQQALDAVGIGTLVNHPVSQLPVFSTIVLLESGLDVSYELNLTNLSNKYGTVIDPHGQIETNWTDRTTEHFVGTPKGIVRASTHSVVDYDYTNFFKKEVMRIFRWLKGYENKFSVIYAGATYEHAISMLSFMDIVEAVRYKLSQGYTKIIFYNGDETVQPNSIMTCQRVAEYLSDEIEPDTLFYYTGGLSIEHCYEQLKQEHGFTYHMHPMAGTRFELTVKQALEERSVTPDTNLDALYEPYQISTTKRNFVCFNRVPRWHRLMLVLELLKRNLVKNSYYSFDFSGFNRNGNDDIMIPVQKEIDRYAHLFPMVLNRSAERDNPVGLDPDDIKYHHNSYFSLVCETIFYSGENAGLSDIIHAGSVFLSEKIYKPLAYKHPFLLVGFPGTLEYLRTLGYKTFHPYIDERYDSMEDDFERMDAIVNEVERLCNQTPEQWLEWQQNVMPIVEHNFLWFLEDKDLSVTPDLSDYFR